MAYVNTESFSAPSQGLNPGVYTPSGNTVAESPVSAVSQAVDEVNGQSESNGSADSWLISFLQSHKDYSAAWNTHDSDGNNHVACAALAEGIKSGEISPTDAQFLISKYNIKVTPSFETYLNNALSKEATTDAYNLEIQSIGDKARATQQASIDTGLNYSGYAMSNGMMSGAGLDPANVYKSETAENRVRDRFNAKTGMARTLIGLASGMASMGIHGASMFAARKAVAGLTTAATRDAAKIKADSYLKGKVKSKYHIKSDGTITGWSNYNY